MNLVEYSELAGRTCKPMEGVHHLVHMALGLSTELLEYAEVAYDALGKHTHVDDRLLKHQQEELGDLCWYGAGVVNYLRDIDPRVFDLEHIKDSDGDFYLPTTVERLASYIKKVWVYEKPLDKGLLYSLAFEFFVAIHQECEKWGFDIEQIMQDNITKLQKRYPEKYTNEAAVTRLDKQHGN